MALPYPEGEVYFKRSLLKYPGFAMDTDDKAFYSNVLVECVWNLWYNSNAATTTTKNQLRAKYMAGKVEDYNTTFGLWRTQSALFSDSNDGTHVTREIVLEKNTNLYEVRDADKGGIDKVHLQPVTLGPERYMYLDLTVPVRAIYFPIAAKSSAFNEEVCTYLMVDFRLRKGVKMRNRQSDEEYDVPYSYRRGLGWRAYQSLCFDVRGIYEYLVLPQKMRNMDKGLYQTTVPGEELINMLDSKNINEGGYVESKKIVYFSRDIDLARVISDNFGVDVCWTPFTYETWVFDVLKNITALGLSFIPICGPLCSIAFTVAMSAITDPETFKTENILKLSPDTLVAVCTSAAAMKKNIPIGFFTKLIK